MKWNLLVCLAVGSLAPGCMLFGGLRVDPVATSAQPPSNVAVYLSASNDGHPVTGLTEKSFQIAEDGLELTPEQTRQTLLPRDMAATHRALLLLDLSGPVMEGDTRKNIADAAARFVTRAHVAEAVTVVAFDGGPALRFIAEFPEGSGEIAEIPGLASYTPSDPSSNLHSAVIEALTQLDARLMTAQKPLRIGSLVVFARGPDLAGRVPEAKMMEALGDSKQLIFAIGIKDAPGFRARRIGRAGSFEAESPVSLLHAFDEAGAQVAEAVGRYYLLSYCSPARAGQRRLRVRIVTTDGEGKETKGTLSTTFDATGFSSGCDPAQRPRFTARAEPEPPQEATHDDKDKPKPKSPGGTSPARARPAGTPPAPQGGTEDDGDSVAPPPSTPGYAR
jgi:hypothetical protein